MSLDINDRPLLLVCHSVYQRLLEIQNERVSPLQVRRQQKCHSGRSLSDLQIQDFFIKGLIVCQHSPTFNINKSRTSGIVEEIRGEVTQVEMNLDRDNSVM